MADSNGRRQMKIADFIRINDSARTIYNVYRDCELVDIIEKDYLTGDPKLIPEVNRRIKCLIDAEGFVESVAPYYRESKSQIWLEVDVQIGIHDYPDRL